MLLQLHSRPFMFVKGFEGILIGKTHRGKVVIDFGHAGPMIIAATTVTGFQ